MSPRTWVMLGDKRGDNGQVQTLVEALGWPVEHRFLQPLPQWVLGKPRFAPSLSHLDRERSDALCAPWPDLILTSGRRPSMAALWVRQQSGGRTRIVLVGKPSGYLRDFDLIVASRENQLPPFPNVITTVLPFMQVDAAAVQAARRHWAPRLAALPRPLVAILVGGETNPFVMDARVAHQLVALAQRVVADGGTPWISTSRRTTADVVAVLKRDLPAQAQLYTFATDAPPEDNPYLAMLGTADAFAVTADSISMQVEVLRLAKPLAILPLPVGRFGAPDLWRRRLATWLNHPDGAGVLHRCRRAVARGLYRIDSVGLVSVTRDFQAFHRELVERGLAVWAGDWAGEWPGEAYANGGVAVPDDLGEVVRRVRALFPPGSFPSGSFPSGSGSDGA